MGRKKEGGGADAGARLSPVDVQQVQFRRALRGYDEQEVDDFLDRITEELTRLLDERRSLTERAGQLPTIRVAGGDDAAAASRQVEELVAQARERADTIVREAQQRAAEIVRSAEAKAGSAAAPATLAPAASGAGVAGFVAKEREFLQQLASLVQGHAQTMKEMVASARESGAHGPGAAVLGDPGSGATASGRHGSGVAPSSGTPGAAASPSGAASSPPAPPAAGTGITPPSGSASGGAGQAKEWSGSSEPTITRGAERGIAGIGVSGARPQGPASAPEARAASPGTTAVATEARPAEGTAAGVIEARPEERVAGVAEHSHPTGPDMRNAAAAESPARTEPESGSPSPAVRRVEVPGPPQQPDRTTGAGGEESSLRELFWGED